MFSNETKKHLPMVITYSRIVLTIPIVILILVGHNYFIAAILFVIASFTDWLDGFLARKFSAESSMGKLMDPIADKILVLGALIVLLNVGRIDPIMVIILLSRDIFIGGIRSVAAANNIIIAAKPFGKWKTAFQMTSVPILLISDYSHYFWDLPLEKIGYYGLWISVSLSLISGMQYTFGYYKGHTNV